MIRLFRRAVLGFALAAVTLMSALSVAHAQKVMYDTLLTVLPLARPLEPGRGTRIDVRLTTNSGVPVPGKGITLTLADQQRTVATNENGVAEFIFQVQASAGAYRMNAEFKGDSLYRPAVVSQMVQVGGGVPTTRIEIQPLGTIPMGARVAIRARLLDENGMPVPNERLQLYVDSEAQQGGVTDANGIAAMDSGKDISAGVHRIQVVYDGQHGLAPATATLDIGVNEHSIEIHTVPALAGVSFSMDGNVFKSDKNGIVSIPADKPGSYHVELLPFTGAGDDVKAEFSGWADNTFTTYKDIPVPTDGPIQVGFNLSYKVSQSFIDLDGRVVDPRRVSALTFKRSDGKIFNFEDGSPRWLEANHVVKRVNGIVPSPFQYSLMSVIVNGTNVVSEQQQRFYVSKNDHWTLQLLLFAAHVISHDQLFGFPLGTSIRLEYPDNTVQIYPLDEKAETLIVSLPRGHYKIAVNTNMGISPLSPLAMSRNQVVDLPVLSWWDMAAAALLALVVGPGILLIGQPGLRAAIRSGRILNPRAWAEHF